MFKEFRYLLFLIVIFFFIFFTVRYYFSDENKKKSYRSFNQIDKKLEISTKDLIILNSDTENIIDFVEYKNNKKTEKYSFWRFVFNSSAFANWILLQNSKHILNKKIKNVEEYLFFIFKILITQFYINSKNISVRIEKEYF